MGLHVYSLSWSPNFQFASLWLKAEEVVPSFPYLTWFQLTPNLGPISCLSLLLQIVTFFVYVREGGAGEGGGHFFLPCSLLPHSRQLRPIATPSPLICPWQVLGGTWAIRPNLGIADVENPGEQILLALGRGSCHCPQPQVLAG